MFALTVVFLMGLATTGAQSGIPRYNLGQWILTDDDPQYDDSDGRFVTEDAKFPNPQPDDTTAAQPLTTSAPHTMTEQESGGGSSVWKPIVVTVGFLVALVPLLSLSYYFCVWRGGRIRYRPQRDVYT